MKKRISEETLDVTHRNMVARIDKMCQIALSDGTYVPLLDSAFELDKFYQAVTGTELEWDNYYILMDDGKKLPITLPIEGVKLVDRARRDEDLDKPRLKYGYRGCWVNPERLLFNITMCTILGHARRRENFLKQHNGGETWPKSWEIHESRARQDYQY